MIEKQDCQEVNENACEITFGYGNFILDSNFVSMQQGEKKKKVLWLSVWMKKVFFFWIPSLIKL